MTSHSKRWNVHGAIYSVPTAEKAVELYLRAQGLHAEVQDDGRVMVAEGGAWYPVDCRAYGAFELL